MLVEARDNEPDRRLVFLDRDDDYWWYDKDNSLWVWRGNSEYIGQPGRGLIGGVWEALRVNLNASTWPWTQTAWINEKGDVVQGHPSMATPEPEFTVKDSGAREEYANGFVRDTEDGKYDYARILRIEGLHLIPIEALERWGAHMVKGAEKYGEDNWKQARGPIAIARFLRSLCRHVVQYIRKDRTEDHAAAVCFNVWAAELTPEDEGSGA